jgi:tetratricopeptide (TPR) repeat protein
LPPAAPPAPRAGVLLAGVLAAVALAYAGALAGGFVWDDAALIERHPAVLDLRPLRDYFGRMFWSNPELDASPAYYRPLTTLSYAVEWRLWGAQPQLFHVTNLLLHLGVCGLVFGLARAAGAPAASAALAALLFGLFPRSTESVAWISGRTDVLAALGSLAGWRLHRSEPGRLGRRAAAAACIALGLLCKEVAVAGAVAIAAGEWVRWRDGSSDVRRATVNLAPLAVALCAYAAVRAAASSLSGADMPADAALPWETRPRLALQALGTYALMLLDPLRPRLLIGAPHLASWPHAALGAVAAVAATYGLTRLVRRGSAHALAGAACALAALAPVLHLLTLPIHTVAADRYLYLPLAGLAVLAAALATGLRPRAARAAAAAGLALALACGATTFRRSALWTDELALWRTAVRDGPAASALAPAALGEALLRRGRPAEALVWLEEAERRRALAGSAVRGDVGPELIAANAALCLAQLGRWDEAHARLAAVVRARPRVALHRFNLALLHAQHLDFDAAERELTAAEALYPGYPRAAELRGVLAHARAAWAALPPPAAGEPTAVLAARAHVHARVRNDLAARALWAAVLAAPDASPKDLRPAAVYLVLHGTPEEARAALARLKALPELHAEALALEQALAARLLEEGRAG